MTVISGGNPLLKRLVHSGLVFTFDFSFFFSAMRLLQVRASPSGLRRETFPFEPPWKAQQGQTNRPLHRESHGQFVFSLMFINMLVVYSLPVLAGRGKHTRFLSEMKGGIT